MNLISSQVLTIRLQATPDAPALDVQVWPDPRGAPNEHAALLSQLILGLHATRQQIAELSQAVGALCVLVTESARTVAETPAPITTRTLAELQRRLVLAREHVATLGDAVQIEIAAHPLLFSPSSAPPTSE